MRRLSRLRQLLRFLDENRDRPWTGTFLAVRKHALAERVRLGGDPPRPYSPNP